MRVLLGGVPFGLNNIGDEAILECAVAIFRELRPDVSLSVCTNDPDHTGRKLSIGTHPAFGFVPDAPAEAIGPILDEYDVFVWCGATGLSDYPEVTLTMLRLAQERGLKTVLWGVGMNNELNPAFYSLGPGKRRSVLTWLTRCTVGLWDAVAWEEGRRSGQGRNRVAEGLSKADLVVVRDPDSREEVLGCGVSSEVHVGADSALILEPATTDSLPLSDDIRARMATSRKKLAVCISAQREVTNRDDLVRYLDRSVAELDVDIVFLPMNPITDYDLMKGLQSEMEAPDRTILVDGLIEPADVLGFLPQLDVIVSSRLHLLILASIVHVPIIGISRGSKVDNFLKPYGLRAMGSVEECDFSALFDESKRLLAEKDAFADRSASVRADLLERMETAKALLRPLLHE